MEEIQRTIIGETAIQERVQILGKQISDHYTNTDPLILIGILKGALYFLADLSRSLTIPVEIELMSISSYGAETESSGVVSILTDLARDIKDRDVLVVEDIIDSGLTMSVLLGNLEARNPASLKVCTLLDKASRRNVQIPIAYCGFEIADEFVVGYGLDFNQRFRNLPYIGTLNSSVIPSQ